MRVLFWGTPDFAVPSLRALVGESFDVVGVVTQPDRAVKRSRSTVTPSPVKVSAIEEGIPVLQPETPRDPLFVTAVRDLGVDVSAVVAYGHILPPEVIELPHHGTVNAHASLLPKLRGAAPIQTAILQGLDVTGVTIMRIVPALDAGPILMQSPAPILDDETSGELQLRLSELAALALVEALTLLEVGSLTATPQNDEEATYAPKIDRAKARLDFRSPAAGVARAIRAFDPAPGAFATLRGKDVRFFGARPVDDVAAAPGEVVRVDGQGMLVGCGTGAVRVQEVHPAGRKRQTALEWANGRGVSPGDRFGTEPSPTA